MAQSTGKTIGLVLLVIVLFLIVFGTMPFVFAPLGVFPHLFQWVKIPFAEVREFGPYGFFRFTSFSLFTLTLLVIWVFVIVWVYRDAERRGMNGVLWALLVFIGNLVGLLIYLIVRSNNLPAPRPEQAFQSCPKCHLPLSPSYIFCPHCGVRLQPECPKCHNPVEARWNVCPHCGENLKS
ncbi:MAG: zinc ribbon domain-containing protein [Candidatus Aminicenantales bacterium]